MTPISLSTFSTRKIRITIISAVRIIGSRVRTRAERAAWPSREALVSWRAMALFATSHTRMATSALTPMEPSAPRMREPSRPWVNQAKAPMPQASSSRSRAATVSTPLTRLRNRGP